MQYDKGAVYVSLAQCLIHHHPHTTQNSQDKLRQSEAAGSGRSATIPLILIKAVLTPVAIGGGGTAVGAHWNIWVGPTPGKIPEPGGGPGGGTPPG